MITQTPPLTRLLPLCGFRGWFMSSSPEYIYLVVDPLWCRGCVPVCLSLRVFPSFFIYSSIDSEWVCVLSQAFRFLPLYAEVAAAKERSPVPPRLSSPCGATVMQEEVCSLAVGIRFFCFTWSLYVPMYAMTIATYDIRTLRAGIGICVCVCLHEQHQAAHTHCPSCQHMDGQGSSYSLLLLLVHGRTSSGGCR
jgi:hypothetical protein